MARRSARLESWRPLRERRGTKSRKWLFPRSPTVRIGLISTFFGEEGVGERGREREVVRSTRAGGGGESGIGGEEEREDQHNFFLPPRLSASPFQFAPLIEINARGNFRRRAKLSRTPSRIPKGHFSSFPLLFLPGKSTSEKEQTFRIKILCPPSPFPCVCTHIYKDLPR